MSSNQGERQTDTCFSLTSVTIPTHAHTLVNPRKDRGEGEWRRMKGGGRMEKEGSGERERSEEMKGE